MFEWKKRMSNLSLDRVPRSTYY